MNSAAHVEVSPAHERRPRLPYDAGTAGVRVARRTGGLRVRRVHRPQTRTQGWASQPPRAADTTSRASACT